jgi:hypothetical protein
MIRPFARAALVMLGWAGIAFAAAAPALHFHGRILYRATKGPVAGVLVELVQARDDGQPTDNVLGSTRADPSGRFDVVPTEPVVGNVALVVSAVGDMADTGGDRRAEGYEIKTHRIPLGFLSRPSPTKSNTVLVTRRRPSLPDNG